MLSSWNKWAENSSNPWLHSDCVNQNVLCLDLGSLPWINFSKIIQPCSKPSIINFQNIIVILFVCLGMPVSKSNINDGKHHPDKVFYYIYLSQVISLWIQPVIVNVWLKISLFSVSNFTCSLFMLALYCKIHF